MRFAKLSFTGVVDFDGGWPDEPFKGVARPEAGGVGFSVENAVYVDVGCFCPSAGVDVHFNPAISSMIAKEGVS